MKRFVRVLIRTPEERFLVLRELGRPWWNFPGGKVERDELPIEAARRELLEEVGLDAEITSLELIHQGVFDLFGISWEGFFYFAHRVSGHAEPREGEGIALSWSTLEELRRVASLPGLLEEVAHHAQTRGLSTHRE
ncbi:NUDIX hydrolase [Polyangium sorediatum]|uniref:NUDIX hydrolase n=1 Tax=Polyangium sorediatum TaxID=889274 RepID=A0ABT6NNC9_9BACT|nr:NUDIX hydrolase [Polyangium sorediatum]MDI1429837.1 NUDIX hydrolase [Polyangium sorediatum]